VQVNDERLAHVGPRDPANGYPLWYEDAEGVRLALGLSRGEDPNLIPIDDVEPGDLVIPGNFPHEAFYWSAEAELAVGGNGVAGRARLILALEAAFGGAGDPADDARVVFARIRVRMDDVIPFARYVVTHPYGVTDELEADEDGRVAWTDDRGIADENFDAVVLAGRVAPFLRWDTGAPTGYVGDSGVEHTVTGSPFGTNLFRITGPRIAVVPGQPVPTDPDVVETDLFAVQGKVATVRGVAVERAVYTRQGGQTTVDVFALSAPGQEIELGGAGVPRTTFVPAPPAGPTSRAYTVRVDAAAGPPGTVDVLNVSDQPATRVPAPVTDQVTITRAEFDVAAGLLTVEAQSSDDQESALEVFDADGARPELIGPIAGSPFTRPAPPATILVRSASSGEASAAVSLTGAAVTPATGVGADAGADVGVDTGAQVQLDGSRSRGPVATFAWAVNPPALGTLTGADTATPTYTAPAAPGTDVITLTVSDTGGASDTDTVTVTVSPPPGPAQVSITRAEYRTGNRQLRVEGAVTGGRRPIEVTVTVGPDDRGSSPVDPTGEWSVRTTLTAEQTAPTIGDQTTATTGGGVQASLPIRIRN
jgi:hypothetical protein